MERMPNTHLTIESLPHIAKWFCDNLPEHFFYQNFTFNVQYTDNHQLF